jgi:hypothetical protein
MSPCAAPAVRDCGLALLSGALPADFAAGLSGVTRRGVAVYPVTLQTDDADGAVVFRNADGEPFYAVGGGLPDWSPSWIADLHGVTAFHAFGARLDAMLARRAARGIPTNGVHEAAFMETGQGYRPSHLVHAYTLIAPADLGAYLAAPQPVAAPMAGMAASPPPLTGLTFAAFAADSAGVALALEWPPGTAPDGDAVDLFHTRSLAPQARAWTNVFRYPVPAGMSGFSDFIAYGELPQDAAGTFTVVTNAAGGVTNIVQSQFDPALFYTNVILSVTTNWPARSGFFTAADLRDGDADGLTDAFERLVTKSDPDAADSDSDGCDDYDEWASGLNPLLPDTDGDGLLDSEERKYVRQVPFRWHDTSGGTNLLAGLSGTVSGSYQNWRLPLPQPVFIGGVAHTNMTVDLLGFVSLLHPTNAAAYTTGYNTAQNLATWQWNNSHIHIAALWTSLIAYLAHIPAPEIRVAYPGGDTAAVIEYRNIACGYSGAAHTNEHATFQVILPVFPSNAVYVSYLSAHAELCGKNATIGIQDRDRRLWPATNQYYNLTWSYLPSTNTVSPPMTLEYRLGQGTDPLKNDSDGDGLTDGDEVNIWHSNPLNPDSDSDQVPDGQEPALGTSPTNPDSDHDGMPDGWERDHGLDPTQNDAGLDPDSDRLPNAAEFKAGSDPQNSDTDGDSILDGDEAGWTEILHNQTFAFDVSGGANLLSSPSTYYSSQSFIVPLPFPVSLAGVTSSNASVGVYGLVGLLNPTNTASYYGGGGNYNMTNAGASISSAYHTSIAAYWDYLYANPPALGSQITLADVTTNGQRWCVIEYRNMRVNSSTTTSDLLTLQIAIPQGSSNIVSVRYLDMRGAADGRSATLGAQAVAKRCNLQHAFNTQGAVASGDAVTYCFGTATDPVKRDTDGDGMPDGWEASHGLDALNPADAAKDPNGDDISNLDHYMAGTDPTDLDLDGDGIENTRERLLGTDMRDPDTDGDGTCDYDEVTFHDTDPLDPLDCPSEPSADSMSDLDGDGVLDILDPAPSDPAAPVQPSIPFTVTHPAQGGSLP